MNSSLQLLFVGLAFTVVIWCSVWAQGDRPKPVRFRPGDFKWADNPALQFGGQIAMLVGKPAQEGLYAFRLKFPTDFKVMPHSHPKERIYTVITGIF